MEYSVLKTREIESLASIVAESFNMPLDRCQPWIVASGMKNWRVIKAETTVVGGLMTIPMSQWFGGRPVPMTGLAGVVMSATERGRGAGKELVGSSLKEMAENGVGLSALYGSTTAFYRRLGYERAGATYNLEIDLRSLPLRQGPLCARPLTPADQTSVEALQEGAVRQHGCLQRGPYLWHRLRNPRGMKAEGVGFWRDANLEGYYFFIRSDFRGTENELQIVDLTLSTPGSLETFLAFLAAHRATYHKAVAVVTESTPLVLSLEEKWNYKLTLQEHWMLRVVDLEVALTARGYPRHVDETVSFHITDDLLPKNSGHWSLTIKDGLAELEQATKSRLRLNRNAIAPLYSGFVSAHDLYRAGLLEGECEEIEKADRIFAGRLYLTDYF